MDLGHFAIWITVPAAWRATFFLKKLDVTGSVWNVAALLTVHLIAAGLGEPVQPFSWMETVP